MGREVTCSCQWNGETGEVKALLESTEIILRGEIKRRVPLADVSDAAANDVGLRFKAGRNLVSLEMGASEATRWVKKLSMPLPSLRNKLGLGGDAKAFVTGPISDETLSVALNGATTAKAANARLIIACAVDEAQIEAAIAAHAKLEPGCAIWIVHGKGRQAAFGEAKVREAMRSRGFIDTKVSAVSAALTATRYSRKS